MSAIKGSSTSKKRGFFLFRKISKAEWVQTTSSFIIYHPQTGRNWKEPLIPYHVSYHGTALETGTNEPSTTEKSAGSASNVSRWEWNLHKNAVQNM